MSLAFIFISYFEQLGFVSFNGSAAAGRLKSQLPNLSFYLSNFLLFTSLPFESAVQPDNQFW